MVTHKSNCLLIGQQVFLTQWKNKKETYAYLFESVKHFWLFQVARIGLFTQCFLVMKERSNIFCFLIVLDLHIVFHLIHRASDELASGVEDCVGFGGGRWEYVLGWGWGDGWGWGIDLSGFYSSSMTSSITILTSDVKSCKLSSSSEVTFVLCIRNL